MELLKREEERNGEEEKRKEKGTQRVLKRKSEKEVQKEAHIYLTYRGRKNDPFFDVRGTYIYLTYRLPKNDPFLFRKYPIRVI